MALRKVRVCAFSVLFGPGVGGMGKGPKGAGGMSHDVGSCTDIGATGAAAAQVNADAPGNPEEEPEDPDQPVFSLVSGKYRHAKRYGGTHTRTGDTCSNIHVAVCFCSHP